MDRLRDTFYLHALGDGLGEYPHLLVEKKPIPPTDDTVMTLALLEVLVESGKYNPQRVAEKYLDLYLKGELQKIGYTTYRALERFRETGNWFKAGIVDRRAAGNGVAMRIAPLGVWAYLKNLPLEDFYEYVRWEGYITHRNELAISGAFAVAYAVYFNLKENPREAGITVKKVIEILEKLGIENAVKGAVEKALKLYTDGYTSAEALPLLGTSGFVVHTVGSAFFLFLKGENFLEGIKDLLEVGGDTDTIGAIYGSLTGSLRGAEGVPEGLIDRLEVGKKIDTLVRKLLS